MSDKKYVIRLEFNFNGTGYLYYKTGVFYDCRVLKDATFFNTKLDASDALREYMKRYGHIIFGNNDYKNSYDQFSFSIVSIETIKTEDEV